MAAAASVTFVVTATVGAENWPQWRGPTLNGISAETNLPVKWTKTENIAWKLAMPARSGSTPIVWGDRIFLNVADGNAMFLWAVDRTKGEVAVEAAAQRRQPDGSASRTCRRRRRSPTGPTSG